jgi:hypothetical protein
MTSALDQLSAKTRRAAGAHLADDEEIVTVFAGRSKQAMIVTDRQILIVKPGPMAGAGLGVKVDAFALSDISAINVHQGPRIAALELVTARHQHAEKADLIMAFRQSNWLPCPPSLGTSLHTA